MAKKRDILPKEIRGLLDAGDVEELKKLFARCEPNALCSRSYTLGRDSNIFSLTPLPREFAVWAKEQGADVNFLDGTGYPPVFSHAEAGNGDVQLLIDLGAEVNIVMYDGTTPLHHAAVYGRTEAVKALLDAGVQVDAGMGMTWGTALESAIRQNQLPYATLLEVCTLLLNYRAQITDRARNSLRIAEARFRRTKKKIKDPEYLAQQTDAMQQLCELLGVDPAEKVDIYEDAALMTIKGLLKKEKWYQKQFSKLWEYLVPPSGRAQTAQGEVIRIAGRIEHELLDNGGINWDDDFRKMLWVLPDYFRLGVPLPEGEIEFMERIAHNLRDGAVIDKDISWLRHYAVWWVGQNSQVMTPLPADYAR